MPKLHSAGIEAIGAGTDPLVSLGSQLKSTGARFHHAGPLKQRNAIDNGL
jgi:hypothetical protein